ncbi:MAG: helix-turn-helix transcriptional regulator [Solibacillus sp.]
MFTKKIKTLRNNRDLTQSQLADKIEVARTTYAMYEQGKREPDFETLKRLADFFNVSTDYLLDSEDRKEKHLTNKDERDIAKRLESFKDDLENSDGLAFDGEPMSDEAKESLLESMELLFKQTQRINKKFTPKKYREDE